MLQHKTKQGKYYHAQFCNFSFKFAYLKKTHEKWFNGTQNLYKNWVFSSINLLLKLHTKFLLHMDIYETCNPMFGSSSQIPAVWGKEVKSMSTDIFQHHKWIQVLIV